MHIRYYPATALGLYIVTASIWTMHHDQIYCHHAYLVCNTDGEKAYHMYPAVDVLWHRTKTTRKACSNKCRNLCVKFYTHIYKYWRKHAWTCSCGYPCDVIHYSDVIMCAMVSEIIGVLTVNSTVCSGIGQRKHRSFASLAFVRGIHRWQVNSPPKEPVKWAENVQFDDVIMCKFTKV